MKALNTLLILLTSALLMYGCGGKKDQSETSFSIQVGSLVTGAALDGGVVISGTSNNGHNFVFSTPFTSNVKVPLPPGIWDFRVMGWKSASNPFEGENVCGARNNVEIGGASSDVGMVLSQAQCANIPQADPALSYTATPGQFRPLVFNSCLYIAGLGVSPVTAARCDDTTLDLKKGVSPFIKIRIPSVGNIPLPPISLSSRCLSVDGYVPPGSLDLSGSSFTTSIRLPVNNGSTTPFPIQIVSFDEEGCDDVDNEYIFPNGFGGARGIGSASIAYDDGASVASVAWSDNYIGSPDSAFRHASASPILPFINCAGGGNALGFCHDQAATSTAQIGRGVDDTKETIYRLFGTPEQFDANDKTPQNTASGSHVQNGITITLTANQAGESGNSTLTLNDSGTGGGSVVVNIGARTVLFDNDVSATDVVNGINAQTIGLELTANCSAGPCGSIWSDTTSNPVNLTGGTDLFEADKRRVGAIPDIKEMMAGPVGAILFDNGITNLTQICAATGSSFQKVIKKDGKFEAVSIDISLGSIDPPDHLTPTNTATPFDRRITLSLDGVPEFAFEFNCVTELGTMWFAEHRDDEKLERREILISHGTPGTASIEMTTYREDDTGSVDHKEWIYFLKSGATSYELFKLLASPSNTYYSRLGAKVDMGAPKSILTNLYDVSSGDTKTHFTGDDSATQAPTETCDHTGGFATAGTCGTMVTTELHPNSINGSDSIDPLTAPYVYGGAFSISNLETLLDTDFNSL